MADKKANIDEDKQAKLKNKSAQEKMDAEIDQMSVDELRENLSNKNADYVFRLQRELASQGKLTQEKARGMVDELLPEILKAQRRGQPANGLYMAAPKMKANELLHPEENAAPKPVPFWQRSVDSALLYLAIFTGLFGIMELFSNTNKTSSSMGILSIASVGILMGVFMTKYEDWVLPNGSRSKVSWPKLIGVSFILIVGLFAWMWILALPAIQVINPVLPGIWYIIIAAAAYGGRYLFRKYYGIVGSTMGRQSVKSKK